MSPVTTGDISLDAYASHTTTTAPFGVPSERVEVPGTASSSSVPLDNECSRHIWHDLATPSVSLTPCLSSDDCWTAGRREAEGCVYLLTRVTGHGASSRPSSANPLALRVGTATRTETVTLAGRSCGWFATKTIFMILFIPWTFTFACRSLTLFTDRQVFVVCRCRAVSQYDCDAVTGYVRWDGFSYAAGFSRFAFRSFSRLGYCYG